MKHILSPILPVMMAMVASTLAARAAPKRLLVVEVTTGYRHASIATAEKILAQLAKDTGEFTVDFVRQPPGCPTIVFKPAPGKAGEQDPAYQKALKKFETDYAAYKQALERWMPVAAEALKPLSPENLKNYDGVVFASTTGFLPLPDKAGFLKWIADGHAFIGIHAATDTFHDDPDFIAMIGGEFKTHGPQVEVDIHKDDANHPATKELPEPWVVYDEIYQFKNFERGKVRSLLSMDKHPNDKTPGFYPVSWCKRYGTGRVFYTSLGHRDDVWDPTATDRRNAPEIARQYQQHLLGGIRWALGTAAGDDEPQKQ